MTAKQKLQALIKRDGLNESPEQEALRAKINQQNSKASLKRLAHSQLKATGWLDKKGRW